MRFVYVHKTHEYKRLGATCDTEPKVLQQKYVLITMMNNPFRPPREIKIDCGEVGGERGGDTRKRDRKRDR